MQVNINGQKCEVPDGCSVSVVNNVLYVDGKKYEGQGYTANHFKIEITGGVANVKIERGDVTVNGDVAGSINCGDVTVNGNVAGNIDAATVTCGSVGGKIDCTTITCGDVGGDIEGTTVTCGDVKGDIEAMKVIKK